MARPLSALVLSPHPDIPGGVVAYAETMKASFTYCRVMSLPVGQQKDKKESIMAQIQRWLRLPLSVVRMIRQRKVDIVHINPSLNAKSLIRDGAVLLALRLTGFRKIIVSFHGWQPETEDVIRRAPPLRALFIWLLNGTGRVMVLSPDFQQALINIGVKSDKIVLASTMFDGKKIRKSVVSPNSSRSKILFMSRFRRAKGVYELIEAFTRIADEFPDVDLVMAGDGPERETLRNAVADIGLQDRIFFPGYLQGEEKTRTLQDCAVFVLPTFYPEGMPVALLEAMAAGKPLLTSSVGGIKHLVAEPDNGVVLGSVTVDTVASGLRRLLRNPGFREEAGARNALQAWQNYEARIVTGQIEALYREIA